MENKSPSCIIAIALVALASAACQAQTYPAKPIRLIMGLGAGSSVDVVTRAAAQELAPRLGQPIVVENRPGGSFIIGADACAKAAPDGYTTCVVNIDSMSLNPNVFNKLPYDPDKDFTPIGNLFNMISGVVVSGSLPVASIKELQSLAGSRPGAFNFATVGPGTNPDIFRQWLGDRWKSSIVGIPYKGGNFMVNALMADECQLTWVGLGGAIGQVKANKVKVMAVGSVKRSPLMPDVPTLKEVGLEEFPGLVWWGLAAPAGIPNDVTRKLNAEVNRLLKDAKFNEYLASQMFEPLAGTPEEFAVFLKSDRERVGQLVRKFNVPRQ